MQACADRSYFFKSSRINVGAALKSIRRCQGPPQCSRTESALNGHLVKVMSDTL